MKALILRADAKASVETARVLIEKGFQILTVDTLAVAHALIRVDTIDLLVMDERIEGQLTHAIALSGERRNPYLSALLLTDRPAEEADDLYDLIPCLYGLAGTQTAPELLGKLAICAVSNVDTAVARMAKEARAEAQFEAEAGATAVVEEMEPLILSKSAMAHTIDDDAIPAHADVAIAAPAMAELEAADPQFTFQRAGEDGALAVETTEAMAFLQEFEDAVSAEVAALFRKPVFPPRVQSPQAVQAKAG